MLIAGESEESSFADSADAVQHALDVNVWERDGLPDDTVSIGHQHYRMAC